MVDAACTPPNRSEEGARCTPTTKTRALVAPLAPRLQALHEANGGGWSGTMRDALALLQEPTWSSRMTAPAPFIPTPPHTPREDD